MSTDGAVVSGTISASCVIPVSGPGHPVNGPRALMSYVHGLFQGYYRGGRFVFSFKVGSSYPHEPPKVKCDTMVSRSFSNFMRYNLSKTYYFSIGCFSVAFFA